MSKKQTIHQLKTEIAQLKKGTCKPFKNMRKAELVAYLAELKGGKPAPAPAPAPVKKVKKKVVKKPRQSLKEFKEEKEGKEENPPKASKVKKQAPPLPKSKPPPRMKIPQKPSFKPPPIPTAKKAKTELTFQQKASKAMLLKKIRKFNKDFSLIGIKKMLGDITEQNRDERVKRVIKLFKNDVFDIGKQFQENKKIIESHSTPANKKLIEQYSNTGNNFGPSLQQALGM